ncbi:hypothetical protein CIHG_03445 [Coccidioides immitis H538.4]|uniref:Uncharacterized protein n=2 Tax=Coccidioides immitis TaxID=5501 RepID=A0A0J8RMU4_COCIT|nr:hypothetical protein CIRG_08795 [Coccidioides immitis RMSCC 2394]KMU85916.1 hypothetical protein CIHG_03445 [Coccidioides immitis H538.4]
MKNPCSRSRKCTNTEYRVRRVYLCYDANVGWTSNRAGNTEEGTYSESVPAPRLLFGEVIQISYSVQSIKLSKKWW